MLANCSLVLLLQWGFDYKQVDELGLLVIRLVVGTFSQLQLLSVRTILRLETGETVQTGWIVFVGDLRDDHCYGALEHWYFSFYFIYFPWFNIFFF